MPRRASMSDLSPEPAGAEYVDARETDDDSNLSALCQHAKEVWRTAVDDGEAPDPASPEAPPGFDALSDLVERIAASPARGFEGMAAKVGAWRWLTHEDIFDADSQGDDEKLIVSIINDIERLYEEELRRRSS